MSIQRRLRQFRQRLLTLTLVVVGVMVNLAWALRPYFSAWYDYFFTAPTTAPCNCSQLVTLPTHSLTLDALLGLLGVFVVLLTLAARRFLFTVLRTQRYQTQLAAHILHTTYWQGTAIHRVDRPEALAACLGYVHPAIYISRSTEQLLEPAELFAVLKHELYHAKQHDPLQRLMISTLATLFPFAAKPFSGYHALQELAADEAVHDDKQLRQALMKLLQRAPRQLPATVVGFTATTARIDRLLGQRITLPAIWPVVLMATVFIAVTLLTYQDFSVQAQASAFSQCVAAQPMCEQLFMSYVLP
jgi:hypothetical protein